MIKKYMSTWIQKPQTAFNLYKIKIYDFPTESFIFKHFFVEFKYIYMYIYISYCNSMNLFYSYFFAKFLYPETDFIIILLTLHQVRSSIELTKNVYL